MLNRLGEEVNRFLGGGAAAVKNIDKMSDQW
jgi:hypothetical protein